MIICTWMGQLVWAVIAWNVYTCWRFLIWTIGVITLPMRALSALRGEKLTARHFEELQFEIENLLWNHKRLEAQFSLSIEERKLLETMLGELEEEHDKAIVQIEHLEKQVHNIKIENLDLREIQGKRAWDIRSKEAETPSTPRDPSDIGTPSVTRRITSTEGVQTRKRSREKQSGTKVRLNQTGLADPITPLLFSDSVDPEEALEERRNAALSQSLFSALLSLLVGTVVYEAKDPCMPLVVALFVVVGMSFRSVINFLSTIKNKPASDAVALLSFNWFILGTLTYPTLPKAARFLYPIVLGFIGRTLTWFTY